MARAATARPHRRQLSQVSTLHRDHARTQIAICRVGSVDQQLFSKIMSLAPPAPDQPAPDLPAPDLTVDGFMRGVRIGLPIGGSGFIYGLAFGSMAGGQGLSALESMVMSALVYSGTAQIAIVQIWGTAPALLPVVLIVFVANIRYVLMGAALRPWLGGLAAWKSHLALFFMVDGAFALATRAKADGDQDVGLLLGAGIASYIGWVTATGLGHLSGQLLADPRALALDFVVIAFCASTAAVMMRGLIDVWPPAAAAAVVIAVDRISPGPWAIVAAGLAAAVVAMARYRPKDGQA